MKCYFALVNNESTITCLLILIFKNTFLSQDFYSPDLEKKYFKRFAIKGSVWVLLGDNSCSRTCYFVHLLNLKCQLVIISF